MDSAWYSIRALVASDLVPWTVRQNDFLHLPVTGTLPSEALMRYVPLPVFFIDPMPDNELLSDIVCLSPSSVWEGRPAFETSLVKRWARSPFSVFGHSAEKYCFRQILG